MGAECCFAISILHEILLMAENFVPMKKNSKFSYQYNATYQTRLKHFKPIVKRAVEAKWGITPLSSLFEINETTGLLAIQGLIYVSSRLKPSIFEEINDKRAKREARTYYSDDVTYFVEDEGGRVEIQFENRDEIYEKYKVISTGMAIGLLGFQRDKSIFCVTDLCFPGNIHADNNLNVGRRVCLASCLGIGGRNFNFEKMRIILHYLCTEDIDEFILMGGFFPKEIEEEGLALEKINALCKIVKQKLVLIPSLGDPTSKILPQRPLHKRLFALEPILLPNPSLLSSESCRYMLSSGENVMDLLKYFPYKFEQMLYSKTCTEEAAGEPIIHSVERFLDAMETIMHCRYMCPTSPDTLKSEPIGVEDPFILEDHCNVFFCGNAPDAGTRKIDGGTCLVAVPNFERSGTVMLFDTLTSKYELVQFEG